MSNCILYCNKLRSPEKLCCALPSSLGSFRNVNTHTHYLVVWSFYSLHIHECNIFIQKQDNGSCGHHLLYQSYLHCSNCWWHLFASPGIEYVWSSCCSWQDKSSAMKMLMWDAIWTMLCQFELDIICILYSYYIHWVLNKEVLSVSISNLPNCFRRFHLKLSVGDTNWKSSFRFCFDL